MKRQLKPADLQVEIAQAHKKGSVEGRAFMQQIARGEIIAIDDNGQPLDFSAGPTTANVAPRVELERDHAGRMRAKACPLPSVEPREEVDMDRFRAQMKMIEDFNEEDKRKATKAIYLEHLGIEI